MTTQALQDVLIERQRQIEVENYTATHDDQHSDGSLALAAALYAIPYGSLGIEQEDFFGLHMALAIGAGWDVKPDADPRRRLVKAAALILAEIERLDRASS